MRRSRTRLGWTMSSLALLALAACSSPTSPTEEAETFPRIVPVGTTCGSGTSAVYFIWGLSPYVTDPGASPMAAVLRVGDTQRLTLDFNGCGGARAQTWTSTSPTVASIGEDPALVLPNVVRLTALSVGETRVYVDFAGPDDKVHRTYPAYCPGSIYGCSSPQAVIEVVRVVAGP